MQREGYWDFMGRCLREDREKTRSSYVQPNTNIQNIYLRAAVTGRCGPVATRLMISRIEELEHKVSLLELEHNSLLGGDPQQLELDV